MRPKTVSDADVLTAARETFLEHGPAVSTTVIAQRVGLSQASLFKRFGTKNRLMLLAMTQQLNVTWMDILEEGPDERPIDEQLVEVFTAASHFFDQMMPCSMVLKSSGMGPEDIMSVFDEPPPVRAQRMLSMWLQRAMDQGRMGPCNPKAVAMALLGSMHSRAFLSHITGTEPTFTAEEYVQSVVDAVWRGLIPGEST
jgi:AcrR family transcriptional regulator